jgi:methylphosphotriester-DNA--protein-cysteine methyltransferase
MIRHDAIDDDDLRRLILGGYIRYGGNRHLCIYGRLNCASGRRMARGSRVFFGDEAAARRAGFRPCGHCLRSAYVAWKNQREDLRANTASGNLA